MSELIPLPSLLLTLPKARYEVAGTRFLQWHAGKPSRLYMNAILYFDHKMSLNPLWVRSFVTSRMTFPFILYALQLYIKIHGGWVGGEETLTFFSACVRKIMNNFFIFSQTQAENSDVLKLLPPSFWDAVSARPHWPCLSHSLLHIAISTICPDQVISCRPPAATYATTCFCNIQKCQKIANKSSDVCGSGSIK